MSQIDPTQKLGALTPQLPTVGPTNRQGVDKGSFADLLSGLVNDVNGLQAKAGELKNDLLTGEAPDLHQIMIAGEKAGVAMELLIEVRNKIIEAYQELLRMPV